MSDTEPTVQNAARLIAALSQSHVLVEFDADARILSANPAFLDAIAFADPCIGTHDRRYVPPEPDHVEAHETLWRRLRDGQQAIGDFERVRPDGERVWLAGAYDPVVDQEGRFVGAVLCARVSTQERKRAADHAGQIAAIRNSQSVIEFALDGSILDANASFLDAFGYELHEIIGRNHAMFVDRETLASADYAAFWDALRAGEFRAGEFKRIGARGREVWIQATYTPIFDHAGRPVKVVKYASDISRQRLAVADLAGQLAAIGRTQGVMEFDLDGRILRANDIILETFGYAADDIIGRHHRILVPAEEVAKRSYEEFWANLRSGRSTAGEFRRLSKTGREIWLRATYSPIQDLNGAPVKVVAFATDITDQKARDRDEKDRASQAAQSSAASAARSDFLAVVSHELRTPLNGIIGFSHLLQAEAGLTAAGHAHLELIQHSSIELLSIVDAILTYSSLEAGTVKSDLQRVDVEALASQIVASRLQSALSKGIRLQFNGPGQCWAITDAKLVSDALSELVNNAVRFTLDGSVDVTLENSYRPDGSAVLRFIVADSGPGIPSDKLERLFDRFNQGHDGLDRAHDGTGLGLPIARKSAQVLGGDVQVESREGVGSTFVLEVPAEPCAPVITQAPLLVDAPGDEALRILVVDDHDTNRLLLTSILSAMACEVDEASNGQEALDLAHARAFDLILMDIQMPVMDGVTACRKLRSDPGINRSTPMLAVSANVLPEQVRACFEVGMQGHVPKPVEPNRLLDAIQTCLAANSNRAAA